MAKAQRIMIGIILGLAIIFLFSYRLHFPEERYYDEVYHVQTATEFLALKGYTDTAHPPFGKMLIALGILLLGDHSWVWRIFPLVSALLSIAVLFLMTKKLTKQLGVACLAAGFFALDSISITQGRIAMLNSMMMCFMLLSVLCLIPYAVTGEWSRSRAFLLAGIFLGFGLATRWVSLGITSVLAVLLIRRFREEGDRAGFLRDFLIFFAVIPVAIYFVTYLFVPFIDGLSWSYIWDSQINMARYHATLKETHTYGSAWWSWPLMARPIWYFFERKEELVYGILCIGNPAIFWGIPAALGYTLWDYFRRRSLVSLLILVGFFAQWLPWAFISRVQFFHYFYTVMPFVGIAFALLLARIWRVKRVGPWAVIGYLMLVVGMFVYWYPLLTGFPISDSYFRHHMWFRAWI